MKANTTNYTSARLPQRNKLLGLYILSVGVIMIGFSVVTAMQQL